MPKEKSKSVKKREAIQNEAREKSEENEEGEESTKDKSLKVFCFPKHGISLEAEDMQSALKKLESLTPENDG